ncbi:hypothetical protein AVL48_16550 [Amycolatopsis regifaucium]|uniref:Uncharacterized protein n=1 Tax=Amycolatopsis regifaucium TaxID=546365 RepID=A0A154M455_9PSEU|nr:hypothetical protein AVL48_16550 [Amycolatopsis regifaucium]OKA07393.1 hypothetical protein ATP06_0216230 [Amycolatopsis regifaucium]
MSGRPPVTAPADDHPFGEREHSPKPDIGNLNTPDSWSAAPERQRDVEDAVEHDGAGANQGSLRHRRISVHVKQTAGRLG